MNILTLMTSANGLSLWSSDARHPILVRAISTDPKTHTHTCFSILFREDSSRKWCNRSCKMCLHYQQRLHSRSFDGLLACGFDAINHVASWDLVACVGDPQVLLGVVVAAPSSWQLPIFAKKKENMSWTCYWERFFAFSSPYSFLYASPVMGSRHRLGLRPDVWASVLLLQWNHIIFEINTISLNQIQLQQQDANRRSWRSRKGVIEQGPCGKFCSKSR